MIPCRPSVRRRLQRDWLDVLALQPAPDPVKYTLLLERKPALALLRMVEKHVLETAERSSAVDRDIEQRADPVVMDGVDELHHVAITGISALIRNHDVSIVPV